MKTESASGACPTEACNMHPVDYSIESEDLDELMREGVTQLPSDEDDPLSA